MAMAPPGAPMAYPGAMAMGYPGGVVSSRSGGGFNWVTAVRAVMCLNVLIVIGLLLLIGAAAHNATVPVQTSSGTIVEEQANLGPAFVIAAVVVGAIGVLFIWLAKFTAMRVIMLVLAVISLINNLGGGNLARGGTLGTAYIVSFVIGIVWIGLLVMSLVSPPPPARRY